MASGPITFITGVVFSAEKFQGNPLAIVAVRGESLSKERKQLIAREFGLPETVFIHDAPGRGLPRRVDIFTPTQEVPFAGHPIIGTATYIFKFIDRMEYTGPADRDSQRQSAVFMTKAGAIPVFYNPYRELAACVVPQTFHVHGMSVSLDGLLTVQPHLQLIPTIAELKEKTFPVVSIVNGMNFCLVDLTGAPEVMAALKVGEAPKVLLDEGWEPGFQGCLYFERRGVIEKEGEPPIHNLHTRMIEGGTEDPGTGSANCALACYLVSAIDNNSNQQQQKKKTSAAKAASTDGEDDGSEEITAKTSRLRVGGGGGGRREHHVFAVEQGIEMGRRCQIAIEVDVKISEEGNRQIENIILSGRSTFWAKGELLSVW